MAVEAAGRDSGNEVRSKAWSRRAFLGAAGTAGSVAVVTAGLGAAPSAAGTGARPDEERAMILRVARAGLMFPLRYPASGQGGMPKVMMTRLRAGGRDSPVFALAPGENRTPTMARLRAAEHRMPPGRLALARAGARGLIDAGLLNAGQAALLQGIARRAASTPGHHDELVATVTLAIATVFPRFSPASDATAWLWLSMLRHLDQRGTLRPVLRERGLR